MSHPFREQGWEVEIVVLAGEAGPRIVETSRDAEMVVMSTRGHGATRHLLGSTADFVVPLDGSEHGDEAIPLAAMYGTGMNAKLHLVRVVDPSTSVMTVDELREEAGAYLEVRKFRLAAVPGMITTEVRVGSPQEQLLEVLRPGDLVVMATRGRGRIRKVLLGSVSTALVDRAPVPVALIRAMPGEMAGIFGRAEESVATMSRH
jgi:nucleotide-binding universal stress UspA family protein